MSLGIYDSGNGIFHTEEPMLFIGRFQIRLNSSDQLIKLSSAHRSATKPTPRCTGTAGRLTTNKLYLLILVLLGGTYMSCPRESPPFWIFFRYDVYDDIVDLSQTFLVVEEVRRTVRCAVKTQTLIFQADDCEHYAYIYTPLACPFASHK